MRLCCRQGKDLGQFLQDFIWYLRNLLLLQSSDDMEDVLDLSSENLLLLKEECSMIDGMQIMRYIRISATIFRQFCTTERISSGIAFGISGFVVSVTGVSGL